MIEQQHIGTATITVENDDFVNGCQAGYLRFEVDHKGNPIPEEEIYACIASNIYNTLNTSNYNAGFVTGWITALLGKNGVEVQR